MPPLVHRPPAPACADRESELRFHTIYQAHYGAILAYARRRASGGDDAQEAVADTFLVAWRRLEDVPAGPDTLPWLYGVARRVMANQRRGNRRRAGLAVRLSGGRAPAVDDAGARLESGDDRREVLAALTRLRESDREILRLSVWEELPHRQIATVVGCSEPAVAVRLHRARQRLAKEMRKDVPSAGHK